MGLMSSLFKFQKMKSFEKNDKVTNKTKYEIMECLEYSFKHQTIQTAGTAYKGKEANRECQVAGRMDI